MKKILKITGIVFASFIGLAIIGAIIGGKDSGSSSSLEKTVEKNGKITYNLKLDVENSDKSIQEVNFSITDSVMKVKNLDEKKVIKIFEDASRCAKYGAKNPLTFKISSFGFISIDTDGALYASVMGDAENSFGVPGTVLSIIPFKDNLEVDLGNVHGI
jgi:hypothetical protein